MPKLINAGRAISSAVKNTDVILQLWETDDGRKVLRMTNFINIEDGGIDKYYTFPCDQTFEEVLKAFDDVNT